MVVLCKRVGFACAMNGMMGGGGGGPRTDVCSEASKDKWAPSYLKVVFNLWFS